MSSHRAIDKICCAVTALAVLLTVVFMFSGDLGVVEAAGSEMGYESRLFDAGRVHTIDIVMDDWGGFIEGCEDEEYVLCAVVIDGEAYKNVAIRAKGNTSLTQVSSYGSDRYSFKIEFDHYDSSSSYYGLDKLSLNNIIQDNTYMKDFLVYQMMGAFGAASPLCSYAYITVNGEDWGLYLAVEGVEEAFLERNYGSGYGELYKPDISDMGGGRGNGGGFNMEDWAQNLEPGAENAVPEDARGFVGGRGAGGDFKGFAEGQGAQMTPDGKAGFGSMGRGDVSLIYTDDSYSSYQNIFDNAKTDITNSDKDRLIAALKRLNAQEDIENTVDIDAVMRYFVVHNFVCNFDSYTGSMIHNYYLYEKDGVLSMIPWDYNLAFGSFNSSSGASAIVNYPIDTPVSGGEVSSRPMLSWIFSDEKYTELYHEYFSLFISECFDSGEFEALFDGTAALIAPYVEKDPTKFCTYDEFTTGAAALREFCLLRAESVAGQLDGSIPSTSEGQAASGAALIDASDLNLSDMGGTGNGMGGGDMRNAGDFPAGEETQRGDFGKGQTPPDGAFGMGQLPSDSALPEAPPDGDMFGADRQTLTAPQQTETESAKTQAGGTAVTIIVCAAVLALAAAAVALYRKRA